MKDEGDIFCLTIVLVMGSLFKTLLYLIIKFFYFLKWVMRPKPFTLKSSIYITTSTKRITLKFEKLSANILI